MTSTGALAGVRVVDFGRVLAAPYATMMLADLGAEVIKIERPGGGDETRAWGPPWSAGHSTYFLTANRNKRSVVLDLTSTEGQREARQLVASCDVLVENFRPGTMEEFGLGYADVTADHPGLVYCSLTGFGADHGASMAGYDLIVQAVGGLMSITGHPGSEPTKVGVALVDVIAGLHAVTGILAATRHREQTGEGQRVEVNLMSSLLSALTNQASGYVCTGATPEMLGNRHPSIAPYEVFDTADRPFAIAAANDKLYALLVRAIGRPELRHDPRFLINSDRVQHRTALSNELEAVLITAPADHWFSLLNDAGVPCGPINDIAQAFALADKLGLQPVVGVGEGEEAVDQVANPIRLSRTPATYRTPPPTYRSETDSDAFGTRSSAGRGTSGSDPGETTQFRGDDG